VSSPRVANLTVKLCEREEGRAIAAKEKRGRTTTMHKASERIPAQADGHTQREGALRYWSADFISQRRSPDDKSRPTEIEADRATLLLGPNREHREERAHNGRAGEQQVALQVKAHLVA